MPETPPTTSEAYMDYLANRNDLLAIRANTIALVERVIDGLAILGNAGPSSYGLRKAADLRAMVLTPLQSRNYAQARSGIYEFLADDLMLAITVRLINHAAPGIDILAELAAEYDV